MSTEIHFSHAFLYSIVPSLSRLKFGAKFVDISWIYCYGWRLMLTDTINHSTDKHNRTGQTFLQVGLCHGAGGEITENLPWEKLYLDHGELRALLCQVTQSSKCFWRNLWMPGMPGRYRASSASQLHILLCLVSPVSPVSPVSLTSSQDEECWPPELNFTAPKHETIPQSISSQTLQLNLNCW